MNSETEAGKMYKELADNPEVIVNIVVTNEGGSAAEAKDIISAGNGAGSDTNVRIDISQKGSYGLFDASLDLRATIAHEVSGHAYQNYKGENSLYKYHNDRKMQEAIGRTGVEWFACGLENEYRVFLGIKQRRRYVFESGDSIPVPQYSETKKTWTLRGREWRPR